MIEFRLPSLGSDMDDGKLLEWRVRPGDAVARGQVIAVVDTAKAAIDVESWHEGIVHRLLVEPGETVPVGTVLALLSEPGEAAAQFEAAPGPTREVPAAATAPPAAGVVPPGPPGPAPTRAAEPARTGASAAAGRRPVSPAARRRAQALGLQAEALTGSGVDGSVTLADVERAAAAVSAAGAPA
ncbi:MAG: E3 binding domain-containing protein, partial [Burkholderiales bacterium]